MQKSSKLTVGEFVGTVAFFVTVILTLAYMFVSGITGQIAMPNYFPAGTQYGWWWLMLVLFVTAIPFGGYLWRTQDPRPLSKKELLVIVPSLALYALVTIWHIVGTLVAVPQTAIILALMAAFWWVIKPDNGAHVAAFLVSLLPRIVTWFGWGVMSLAMGTILTLILTPFIVLYGGGWFYILAGFADQQWNVVFWDIPISLEVVLLSLGCIALGVLYLFLIFKPLYTKVWKRFLIWTDWMEDVFFWMIVKVDNFSVVLSHKVRRALRKINVYSARTVIRLCDSVGLG